jgi:DNA-binding MarR family transcriptional regulator
MPQRLDNNRHTPSGAAFTALLLEIFRVNGRLIAEGDHLTADLGLTSARWQVLGALNQGPLTVTGISGAMGLRRQSAQRLVDELVRDHMLELLENPRHRRAKLVSRTRRGDAAFRQLGKRQVKWANALAEGFDPDSLAQLLAVLRELRERLQRRDSRTARSLSARAVNRPSRLGSLANRE